MQKYVNPDQMRRVLRLFHATNEPLKSRTIQQKTGLTDVLVRRVIRELNFAGYPIVSGPEGFRLTYEPGAVFAYADSLTDRARWIESRAKILQAIGYQMRTAEAMRV